MEQVTIFWKNWDIFLSLFTKSFLVSIFFMARTIFFLLRHHCGKIKSFLFISLLKKANCLVVQRPEQADSYVTVSVKKILTCNVDFFIFQLQSLVELSF